MSTWTSGRVYDRSVSPLRLLPPQHTKSALAPISPCVEGFSKGHGDVFDLDQWKFLYSKNIPFSVYPSSVEIVVALLFLMESKRDLKSGVSTSHDYHNGHQGTSRGIPAFDDIQDGTIEGITRSLVDNRSTKKTTRLRWAVLLLLSVSGDGWSYEASVISSVLNLPTFIARKSCDSSCIRYLY
jgi:hypothetical protein